MELRAHIWLIISISSLILYHSVEGFNILPSIAQPDSIVGEINQLQNDQGSRGLDQPKDASRRVLGSKEARKTTTPVTSSIVNAAKTISSSFYKRGSKAASPAPTPFSGSGSLSPGLAPSPFSGPAPYPNLPLSPGSGPGPAPSPFSGPSSSRSAPSPSPSGFIDHDVALAIESRIKQSQSDAQSAMDQAKKLLKDPKIASSETGTCLSKCVDKYSASLNELNRAIKDLGVRDVTLLADDFGAVEVDISTCQACFTENIGEDSPLKALEEATTKAARECLNVMDYAA